MNIEFNEHIAVCTNVYPEGFCQHLVSEFESLAGKGAGIDRQRNGDAQKHQKEDLQLFLSAAENTVLGFDARHHIMNRFNGHAYQHLFFDGLQECYEAYCNKYSVLKSSGELRATSMKMQRIDSGGGYHIWHCEQGGKDAGNRALTYMLYLNTLAPEDGAETEFLYQKKRFNPVENTMLLWPAAYTHAHRGNPVLGNTAKYIVTGWFFYD
jgi:hypothetical protein